MLTNCIALPNISSEGNERPLLLSIKTNIQGFEDTGRLRNCYSRGLYVHNWVKQPECESDHKPLSNVEITSGAIILSLYMSVWSI